MLPSLGRALAIIVFAVLLSLVIRELVPLQQPGTNLTPSGFVCPVTEPNGSRLAGESVDSPDHLGNDELWTTLWPGGTVYMLPSDREIDGSFSMKWGWWRSVNGSLTIEGHHLDVEAEPLRADIPGGYGDTGFQVSTLTFLTTGCWEVTGHVGNASLTFVTEVLFGEATPTIQALKQEYLKPEISPGLGPGCWKHQDRRHMTAVFFLTV